MAQRLSPSEIVYNPGVLAKAARPGLVATYLTVRALYNSPAGEPELSDFANGDTVDDVVLSTGDTILIATNAGVSTGLYTVGASAATLFKSHSQLISEGHTVFLVSEGTAASGGYYTLNVDESVTLNAARPETAYTDLVRVNHITVTNTSTNEHWVQVFDLAAVPANGAVPKMSFKLPPEGFVSVSFGAEGRPLKSGGVYVCLSSTAATKTLAATSDCFFDIVVSK